MLRMQAKKGEIDKKAGGKIITGIDHHIGLLNLGQQRPALPFGVHRRYRHLGVHCPWVIASRRAPGPPQGGDALRDPPRLHDGRRRRRHRLQHGRVRADRPGRNRCVADQRGPGRRVGDRRERVRTRGHARPGRQCRRHLLDREFRRDGGPYRRFDHGCAGADPD